MYFSKAIIVAISLLSLDAVLGKGSSIKACQKACAGGDYQLCLGRVEYSAQEGYCNSSCERKGKQRCETSKSDCQQQCRVSFNVRRHLEASDVVAHECANENYVLSLSVEGAHVLLTGEPQCEGSIRGNTKCDECPSLAFHTTNDEDQLEKTIHEYSEKHDDALKLGTFELENLAKAYDGASVGTSKKYNFFRNNCASFVINVLRELDINPTDRKIVKFVSRKLSQKATPVIMKELSQQEDGAAMISAHAEDVAVIENFVSTYIEDRVR